MPPFATFIQHSTGNPSQGNQMRKRNKIIKIGRKEVKLSLFVDDMILYIEYPKYSMGGKLLGLTKEFSRIHQAPLSVEFPRQEYWSGLLFPSPGDRPNPETEPMSLAL